LFFGPVDNTLNEIEFLADLFVFDVFHGSLLVVDINGDVGLFFVDFLEVVFDLFPLFFE
jgi:hypothetical protein